MQTAGVDPADAGLALDLHLTQACSVLALHAASQVSRVRTSVRRAQRRRLRVASPHSSFGSPTARRWELEADDAISALVAACTFGDVPLGFVIDLLAATLDAGPEDVLAAVLPVVRDLIARGFLEPTG